jgi:DNA-3-methyladenine glycosylase I
MVQRCSWCGADPLYCDYHDRVWGRPVSDGRDLFAKLCLDGQQAGLSWITILRKQPAYERRFAEFEPLVLAGFTDADVERCLDDPGIVRNRQKVRAIVQNARAYVAMEAAGETFGPFVWSFVGGRPRVNAWRELAEIPAATPESEAMSKALKKRGFAFVGPTICYAFMQATGMVIDHVVDCHCYDECRELARAFLAGA